MKIVFIGCVQFSEVTLRQLTQHSDAEIVGVITRQESAFNSDFCDLSEIAHKHSLPLFYAEGNNQDEMLEQIKQWNADVIYCFGWSYLLKEEILQATALGVMGYHPAALPKNRGRHPLIWALALGLTETASSFFRMQKTADSGPLLSQKKIIIGPYDDATSLYKKIIATAVKQIDQFTSALANQTAIFTEQDHSQASYWRKRNAQDGLIDWEKPATEINNLIRALAPPYPGADCLYKDKLIKIGRASLVDDVAEQAQAGEILAINGESITIKCGRDAIKIDQHGFKPLPLTGSYL